MLIEAGLSTETRQDQDEWIPALAHHAATDVYESTDDYDQITFVRDASLLEAFSDHGECFLTGHALLVYEE